MVPPQFIMVVMFCCFYTQDITNPVFGKFYRQPKGQSKVSSTRLIGQSFPVSSNARTAFLSPMLKTAWSDVCCEGKWQFTPSPFSPIQIVGLHVVIPKNEVIIKKKKICLSPSSPKFTTCVLIFQSSFYRWFSFQLNFYCLFVSVF